MPCFNYGRYIASTLASVIHQGRDDVEVIVVDDASSDDSVAVAKGFGEPVRVIELRENLGPGGAWGVGLSEARGRFVCKLDADDWQLPGFLDRVEAEFERAKRIGLVATAVYLYADGEPTAVAQEPHPDDLVLSEVALRRRLLRKFFVRMPGTALRREALSGHAPPRTDLRMGEDWEFFLRTLKGWQASMVTEPLAVYRIHAASLTLTSHSTDRLRSELQGLLDVTRDPRDAGYLSTPERRLFALGIAESYLGTVGTRVDRHDATSLVRHIRDAASLAASEDPLAVPIVLRYVAWGVWQRLVVRPRQPRVPVASLQPAVGQ